MGLWTTSGGQNANYIKLLWTKMDEPEAYFSLSWDDTKYYSLKGYITEFGESSYEYQWETVETFKLVIDDWDDKFIWTPTYNWLTRSILNSLLWSYKQEWELWEITIDLWVTTSKKNGKQYKNAFVKNDWKKTEWLIQWDEQQKLIDPITDKSGKIIKNDYTDLNNKLKKEMMKIKFDKISSLLDDDVDNDESF